MKDETVEEIIVIGMFSKSLVNWLEKKFKEVQYIECSEAQDLCKQIRQYIIDRSKEYIEYMYYNYEEKQ